jgi:sentrin-specific protease 8
LPRDEAQSIAASLDLMKKNCVILPINDSSSSSYEFHESGTHWSLLVYNRAEDKYFHLDSLKGCNRKHATIVASKLNLSKASPIELPCLQQSNSWDCGIFVCCHAELIAQQCLYSGSVLSLPKMAPSIPNSQRRKMQEIIDYLSSKKQ